MEWKQPYVIVKAPNHSMGSPVWYLTPENKLYLFYHVVHNGRIIKGGWSVAYILYITSDDFGKTWSQPVYLRKNWFWVIRTETVTTKDRSVVLPVHREMGKYQSMVYINTKLDLTGKWRRYGRLKTPEGCLEPSIVRLKDDSLLCSLRTRDKEVYFSRSMDSGKTWSIPKPSAIPNPSSQTCLLSLKDGRVIMVCNPTTSGRSPLSLFISNDLGETWGEGIPIEDTPKSEFSYPCLIQTNDGTIHLSYTNLRKRIGYCRFKL